MNNLRISLNIFQKQLFKKGISPFCVNAVRKQSNESKAPRISLEKSKNQVTLLGRVGQAPQLRGTEAKPVVLFNLATNTNYKYESGELQQKTDWHRISVFKPYLRDLAMQYITKGSRIYLEGKLLYGEFVDSSGMSHSTTTIVAQDIIFISGPKRVESEDLSENEEAIL